MLENNEYVLQMKNISKAFPGVVALDNVQLNVKKGEVHALMGENGAGKSTLMKILAGLVKPDQGEILLNGRHMDFNSPKESLDHGISMIHQELNCIQEMTIAENIFIGREPCYQFLQVVDRRKLNQQAFDLFKEIDWEMDPDTKLSSLSVAEMQMVEIAKAISYNSDLIIMDEPTSAITDREVEKLFEIIRKLTSKGKSIIYISHKMDEILTISDCVTVLRDGQYVATKPVSKLNNQLLISLMVGRDLSDIFFKEHVALGDVFLEVKGLSKKGKFNNIHFKIHQGEVLGIAGLMGAGRTELVEAIFGLHHPDHGEIFVKNKKVNIRSPKDAISHGIALVPEDRRHSGLNLRGTIKENISIVNLDDFCHLGHIINRQQEKKEADEQIKNLNIKTPSRDQMVNSLSGGNQQKVVLSKWLLGNPDILILDEPTRGIDIGAKAEIYKMINLLAGDGKAIIMISSEMPEILGLSDRVIVLHEGEITGEFTRNEFNQERIMACAAGYLKEEEVS
jgi:inositol transport system ATP-binding protein